ncbi:phage tail protein [Enterobacter roggenkampii]|uniref:phage tail protein n=1 Tax=Enterobacter roggenkampii TaxID=1812935 RepID=UPI002006367D|nr:phage tail protein [Enterobacter roggenkampii]MCK6654595.1 phage tail protein [Enterobacter roggenkampii]
MADEPVKVNVQSRRVDSSILPNTFSQPYRLYIIQQNTDMLSIANATNNAGQLAYEATVRNEQQDAILEDHESRITGLRVEVDDHELRITANTNAISLLDVRLATAEGKIITLRSDVDYLLDEVINIESDMVSKSSTSNQTIQPGGGSFIIGNVPSPTSDKLQVLGSENVSVSYKVAGTQVVNTRKTGWTASTGTALRGAFDSDLTQSIGTTYNQAEIVALENMVIDARRRIKAIEDDLRSHGLIN